jgi:cytochrome c oxidase subunit 3
LAEAAITAHGDHGAHAHHHPDLQHHFDSLEQQHEAATLGMWMFLITEVLFFGGLFLAYMLYRVWYPEAWAEGSYQLNLTLGTINTVVLIGSSLTMAFAVRSAQTGLRRATVVWLILTMVLGLVFLIIKYFEYAEKFTHHHVPGPNFAFPGPHAPQVQIYFSLYFPDDRPACHAHADRLRVAQRDCVDGAQRPLLARVVHAGRDEWPLLALR